MATTTFGEGPDDVVAFPGADGSVTIEGPGAASLSQGVFIA